jgi:hypothetical protein
MVKSVVNELPDVKRSVSYAVAILAVIVVG